jgi:DeoR/GlpR family transcriptional regulator of sugar metabolism
LFIDGSTTCIELAKFLAHQKKRLTIVTNSTLICLELGKTREHKVIGIGGDFDPTSASFVGSVCEEAAKKYFVDMVIISTKGLIPTEGIYESNTGTLRIKQVFAANTRKTILLVDHSKFHQKSLCKVLDISQIHTLVTDDQAPADAVDLLAGKGLTTMIVPLKTQS